MRIAIKTIQVLVGVLFIISGLVKANDPLGLSYKMQEFFELWTGSLSAGHFFAKDLLIRFFDLLHEHSLFLSLVMITLEIVTGVALLVGWMRNAILYLLLVLIVFFTFLTGYAYLSGKFTNCGCFGDCLPISPLTSFTKDVVLLVLIVALLIGRRYIQPILSRAVRGALLACVLLFSICLQWYALAYLPLKDCLPFKKGNSIAEQMKPPPGAITDSTAILFIYEKQGKRYEFTQEQLPADYETYTYVDRIDRLIRKGNAEPRIKGFSLTDTSGADRTQQVLTEPKAVLLFALEPPAGNRWLSGLKKIQAAAQQKNVAVFLVTSSPEKFSDLLAKNQLDVPVFACDFTVIRTAARANPTVYVLRSGTIQSKYGDRQLEKAVADINQ